LLLRIYDAGSKPDTHEVEYLGLKDYEFVKDQVHSIWPIVDMPIFQAEDSFVGGLRFYVIVVQPEKGDPVFLFRSYGKSKELQRSSIFAAIFKKGHFDQIEEPTFLFDRRIDCMSRGEIMYVFRKDSFHKIFRFFEEVKRAAGKILEIIKAHVPISNFDAFAHACEGHLQKMGKLNNIARKPYLAKISLADIKKVIKRNGLKVEITKQGGKEMLVFNSEDKWSILRLLDDDYLESIMTSLKYEVSGKRTLD
jgi:hypothetical protein